MPEATDHPEARELTDDEKHLAKLGYSQDLHRSWSGFSNFAISFSIISILAGCFTNFGAGFNNGGPISISWSWPILGAFILLIGFTMSELVSAYPTSGGIYWWAAKLGGPAAGFFTGWLNLIGLVAVTAGVSYGCATFIDLTISTYSEGYAADYSLWRVFLIFLAVLACAAVLNIFSSHLMAIMNNVSVWWHVVGASIIVLILIFIPDQHQSFSYVFTERFNNSGYADGSTSTLGFWFFIVPFGFLLTQYTITGFDASAHLSEETEAASTAAAKGIWRSIFYSVLGGYILLLCVVFAIPDNAEGQPDNALAGLGVAAIFVESLGKDWATFVLFISASAQFFCATSCMTSASRMTFAFSRDGAIPGSDTLKRLTAKRVPANAVMMVAVASAVLTLPALIEVDVTARRYPLALLRRDLDRRDRPLPRLRDPDLPALAARRQVRRRIVEQRVEVQVDEPDRRRRDRHRVAVPDDADHAGWPTRSATSSSGSSSTTRPIVTLGALLLLTIWWKTSAKNWFTGPKHTIDEAVVEAFGDES